MAEPRRYEIRLFDRTLVEFTIGDSLMGPELTLDDYDDTASALMPCGISMDSDGIWRWLETRSIPSNRKNAAQICRSLGFALGDLEALYRTSLGLSLNDSYWVVSRGFEGAFDDYNLYENSFSEAIGALSVAGEPSAETLHGNTPELTTDGTLRKGWRIIGGKRVLYKGSSDGYLPGEATSEYIASLIAGDCRLNAVGYGLDTWEGELCSTCEDFASKEVSYVPFAVATGETGLGGALLWCAEMGNDCFEDLCDMLVFDALICNTDRHFTNFGILRDNFTGTPVGLAPIFDNGRGLFPNIADDDAEQFVLESALRAPAFGGAGFGELAGRIIGARQKGFLERVSERGIIGNARASRRRVAALDGYVRGKAEELLGLPTIDHAELVEQLRVRVHLKSWSRQPAHRLKPTPCK